MLPFLFPSEDKVNTLRAAFIASGQTTMDVSFSLLSALAKRCGCKRPALSKTALRAIMELAEGFSTEALEKKCRFSEQGIEKAFGRPVNRPQHKIT